MEPGDKQSRNLVDKIVVDHVLPILHNPDDTCLAATTSDPS